MIQVKKYISAVLAIVIIAVSLLPALHVFNHEISSKVDTAVSQEISQEIVDCDLCDFRIANADAPLVFSYELASIQKETVYSISLAETVNLFPKPFFSLRAPPAVNS